jgi:hypothetical protein
MGRRQVTKTTNIISKLACILALIAVGICRLVHRTVACRLHAKNPIALPISPNSFYASVGSLVAKRLSSDKSVTQAAKCIVLQGYNFIGLNYGGA